MSFSGVCGLKIDRVLKVEPFNTLVNKQVKVAYTFKYYGEKEVYRAEHRFDVIKRGPRVLWIHKDNLQFIGDPQGRAYSQAIPPICVGDNLEIAVNLFSMRGLVDPSSLSWEELKIIPRPTENALNYVKDKVSFFSGRKPQPPVEDGIRKIFADLNRICEIQDQELEWYDRDYYPRKERTPELTYLLKLFKIKKQLYAGVDHTVGKIHLLASKPGALSDKRLGVRVIVRDSSAELTSEVKKLGIMIDRHTPIELRVGDTLILYLSLARTAPVQKLATSPNRSLQTSKTTGGVNQLSITSGNEALRRSSYIFAQSEKRGSQGRDQGLLRCQMSATAQAELQKRALFLRSQTATLPPRQSSVSDRIN